MAQIAPAGTGAETSLERVTPTDLSMLGEGRVRYSLFLNDGDGVLNDLMIARLDRQLHLVVNAPHTADDMMWDDWTHPDSQKQAGEPDDNRQENKYWPLVNRVNNALGGRALICSCPPIEFWEQKAAE